VKLTRHDFTSNQEISRDIFTETFKKGNSTQNIYIFLFGRWMDRGTQIHPNTNMDYSQHQLSQEDSMLIDIPDSIYKSFFEIILKKNDPNLPSAEKLIIYTLEMQSKNELSNMYRDWLTHFGNRWKLANDIDSGVDSSITRHQPLALHFLCLNLRGIRQFNDINGMYAGDQLIEHFGLHIYERYSDTQIYRFGGDDFIISIDENLKAEDVIIDFDHPFTKSVVHIYSNSQIYRKQEIAIKCIALLERGIALATEKGVDIVFSE
jgi:GGDEF domain-containing protein